MDYFKYARADSYKMVEIYRVVWSLANYAKSIYGPLYTDALDAAFFHILSHYDEIGDLEHYATRVVGKILLNKRSHEVEDEVLLTTAMDIKSSKVTSNIPENIFVQKEEIKKTKKYKDCLNELVEKFIIDYKLFSTLRPETRKCDYDRITDRYSASVIQSAMVYLLSTYGDAMNKMFEMRKYCHIRYQPNKYQSYFDPKVKSYGCLNNTFLYELEGKGSRVFYRFNIKEFIDLLVSDVYFAPDSCVMVTVEGVQAFLSLSGRIVIGLEELRNVLEVEIIGWFLPRASYRVVSYAVGSDIILSSSRERDDTCMGIDIFGEEYFIPIRMMVSKRIKKN